MTGVCSSGDAGGFGPPVPEEPTHLVVDLPVPDWLEHAFATGEWPEETDNAWSTLSLPEGRYDAAEPVADVEPGAWVAPGVPVDRTGDAEHPVVAAIAAASACLELDGLDWMGAADTGAGLVAARRLTARASALVALLVAQAEEVELHRQNGAATAAVWLANASAVTRRDAYRFARVLDMLDHKDLPATGGTGATVVVTMTLESLLGGLATASLDTGGTISASEARRLACEAGLVPDVLGTKSEVLDLGRTARFHTRAMHLAMATRDKGCIAEGCDRPPHQTHAHHLIPWSNGGHTNTRDGCLVCDQHHHLVHDPLHLTERLGTGKLRFTRRE